MATARVRAAGVLHVSVPLTCPCVRERRSLRARPPQVCKCACTYVLMCAHACVAGGVSATGLASLGPTRPQAERGHAAATLCTIWQRAMCVHLQGAVTGEGPEALRADCGPVEAAGGKEGRPQDSAPPQWLSTDVGLSLPPAQLCAGSPQGLGRAQCPPWPPCPLTSQT